MTTHVGVDYDGVVADTQGFVIDFVQREFGVELALEDFGWTDGRPALDVDLGVEVGGGFDAFAADPDYVAELEPLPGASSALWRLAEDDRFEVSLATHRPPAVQDAIKRWLERNDLPLLNIPDTVPEVKALTSPSLDVLVDDYHGHVDTAAQNGLLGVHLTAAWKSGEPTGDQAVATTTWDEAVAAILEYTER